MSLLELLAVIATVTILGALLIAAVPRAVGRVHAVTCINNLRQLSAATSAYLQDHEMAYPKHVFTASETAQNAWFFPLTGNKDPNGTGVYGASYIEHPGYRTSPYSTRKSPFFCPTNGAKAGGAVGWTTYAINYYVVGKRAASLDRTKILYMDSFAAGDPATTWYFSRGNFPNNGKPWNYTDPVHGKCLNAVFTDGHVEVLDVVSPNPDARPEDKGQLKAEWFE